MIACCVYEGAFQSICQNLKEAIEYRAEQEAAPLNILLCVNALGAPDYFETELAKLLQNNPAASRYLKEKIGICQVMVGMAAMPSSEELIAEDAFAVTTKLDGHIGIDEEPFKGELPQVKQTGGVQKESSDLSKSLYWKYEALHVGFLGKAKAILTFVILMMMDGLRIVYLEHF